MEQNCLIEQIKVIKKIIDREDLSDQILDQTDQIDWVLQNYQCSTHIYSSVRNICLTQLYIVMVLLMPAIVSLLFDCCVCVCRSPTRQKRASWRTTTNADKWLINTVLWSRRAHVEQWGLGRIFSAMEQSTIDLVLAPSQLLSLLLSVVEVRTISTSHCSHSPDFSWLIPCSRWIK